METHAPRETRLLGEKIGELVEAGTVLTLTGDLGSGKTAFVQGIARGLRIPPDYPVTSPTYTLINEYPGRLWLYHVDLYRIHDPEELEGIGLAEILRGEGVAAVEWADNAPDAMPETRMALHLEIVGDMSRKIFMAAYGLETINLLKRFEFVCRSR